MAGFRWTILVSALLAGLVVGCRRDEPAPGAAKELEILCGSSFPGPCDELMEKFSARTGAKLARTVAGSEDFLPHVKIKAKGDVLITHDPYLDYVKEADACLDHAEVGFVAPVLAVQKGNPRKIQRIEDLTKPGLKVALTDPQYSTCGEMVFALLDNKGIKDAVLANVENRLTKGHPTLGNYLKTGVVDAVIMWNGVAKMFEQDLEIVPTPYEYETSIRVHVIGLSYSKHPDLVEQFTAFAKAEGPAVFAAHGYVKDLRGPGQAENQ